MIEREDSGFLARWSRRKEQARAGVLLPEPEPATLTDPVVPAPPPAAAVVPRVEPPAEPVPQPKPAPTLDEVATLTPASDFGRFVARDVSPEVKNAALKKLFADPQFNVMDGLDTYIEDFGRPDPLPESMLRQMVQARFLGLFSDEPQTDAPPPPTAQAAPPTSVDEDPDLRLQPDDAAGPAGPAPGAGGEPGRDA
ncbi:MAG TPA: DUF3306 domain-containing protein [Ideonella sp.]|jgi:hypothetical protein|nr:DUF3306 domain-containing protein [Ideonella sp.]